MTKRISDKFRIDAFVELIAVVIVCLHLGAVSQAATRTWDNDSGDGKWTTDSNWSDDTQPGDGDTIIINNGDTVDWDASEGQNLPYNSTIEISGSNSTLSASGTIRFNNATMTIGDGAAMAGTAWCDLDDGNLIFDNGAICTINYWEQKDYNSFTFNLSSSGFTALTPGSF